MDECAGIDHPLRMTRLTEISDHRISLECQCGHHALLSVAELLERMPEGSVGDAVARTVCAECGERGRVLQMRIVYAVGDRKVRPCR